MVKKYIIGCLLCLPLPAFACGANNENYQTAIKLFKKSQYQAALPYFQSAYRLQPDCSKIQLDLAIDHFKLNAFDASELLLIELISDTTVDQRVQAQAEGMLKKVQVQQALVTQPLSLTAPNNRATAMDVETPQRRKGRWQVATALGSGSNVNNGVSFDQLTFNSGQTLWLADQSKAQSGQWLDTEVAYQKALTARTQVYVSGVFRDHFTDDAFDLGIVRTQLERKLTKAPNPLDPKLIASAGGISLGSHYYLQNVGVGVQVTPQVGNRKVPVSYQAIDSDYKRIAENDSRYHSVNISVPVTQPTNTKTRVTVDAGYKWPASAERLADYTATSVRVRARHKLRAGQELSSSVGVTQQRDAKPYNTLVFGDAKRDLHQQVIDVGWSKQLDRKRSIEAKLQGRRNTSDVKLFESKAVDVTIGMRWRFD